MIFFSRINVLPLIIKHFLTLYDYRTKKICILEMLLLLTFTISIPYILIFYLQQPIQTKDANTFLTVFSIAVGFLTSTLFVLAEKKATPIEAKDLIRLKECFYNTAFSLITSLSIIILYIFLVILNNAKEISNISKYINDINNIGSFIIYALIILFFHSLLMVIKRVFFIFD